MRYDRGPAIEVNPYRLPRTVVPESYKLLLRPDLNTRTYDGEVSIKVKVLESTSQIVLNAITFDDPATRLEPNLVVTEAMIRNSKGTAFNGTIVADPEAQRLAVKVSGQIGVGDWTLEMPFKGKLNSKLKGFYASTFENADGQEEVIATTQFESTDARRAFPCFDEPDMKATFEVAMEVDEKLAAVSNGRVVSETIVPGSREVYEEGPYKSTGPHGQPIYKFDQHEVEGTGRKLVQFAPTMTMSTYILAFIAGNLVATKPVMVDGVQVRVWCVPGKERLTKFALKAAAFSLRYYKNYFGVPYPSDKLDLLALPDFAAGAMENLGAATFRETALLIDEDKASQSALDYVAEVVAHEIAHMWFGDLVTMKWWNGLWLNEAFATFMSYKCVDAWKKDWKVWDKFGLSRAAAFKTDALKTTRPIEFKVVSPEDAEGMFDVLTYEKGCSVLRMLEMYMGEETFRKGISLYIKTHAYGNTEGSDLWDALGVASGMDVHTIMHGWIWTPGFPVISVEKSGDGAVTIKQSQFKYLADGINHEQVWQVPLILRVKTAEGVVEKKHLFTAKEETVYLGEGLEWVVVNAGGHGFYRASYSTELAAHLTAKPQETLSVIERANVLGDQWACVQAGIVPALDFVKLVKLFAQEDNPNVWAFITTPLAGLRRLLPQDKRGKFEEMVRQLVAPALERLGWQPVEGEPVQVSELRGDLFATLALTGNDGTVVEKAKQLFANWKNDKGSVDGEIIDAVVRIIATHGDDKLYDEFYALFKNTDDPEEESRFRSALLRFRHGDLHQKTLSLCLDPKQIRTQDAPSMVAGAIGHELHGVAAWNFAKDNWQEFHKLFAKVAFVHIARAFPSLDTAELEADVQAFLAANPITVGEKMVSQSLEMQRINRLLRERETPALTAEFAA
jgi:puromycin-sensitive aminopeptidase